MHGWIPAYHNVHPALIALHKKAGQEKDHDFQAQIDFEKEHVRQWVARPDQAEYLRRHGYRHVRAIGLPFCYLPEAKEERVPGSLLVMPPHGHGTHGPDDPLAEAYAEAIAARRDAFSEVLLCVSVDDMIKRQWVSAFEKRGIPVVVGADQSEPDTLVRFKRLLSRFEFITTNGFGSQIAYAACCGAKVSVHGPFAEFPLATMMTSHAVRMYPHIGEAAHELCAERSFRAHFPFLFTEPEKATRHLDWGWREIGGDQRLSPAEMKDILAQASAPSLQQVA
jgi:hypothetical protein